MTNQNMMLTDKEILAAGYNSGDPNGLVEFGRNVEAAVLKKLREQSEPKTRAHHSAVRKVLKHFNIPLDGVLEADLIYAVLDISPPVPSVPDGYQLVPVEPTGRMHIAAVNEIQYCTGSVDFPPRVYKAMLAAAKEKTE